MQALTRAGITDINGGWIPIIGRSARARRGGSLVTTQASLTLVGTEISGEWVAVLTKGHGLQGADRTCTDTPVAKAVTTLLICVAVAAIRTVVDLSPATEVFFT
jgi:hypothetical protein